MKIKWALCILLWPYYSFCQNENNTWLFGTWLGMKFNNGIMSAIPDRASSMHATVCSSISDASGNLLFYSNGQKIWNRLHSELPNGTLSTPSGANGMVLFVKGTAGKYFLFYSDETSNIYYACIDQKLNGGFGDVVYKDRLFSSGLDLQMTAVPLYNQQGYWLIAHRKGTNTFAVYQLVNNAINSSPVLSSAGNASYASAQYYNGKIISNRQGTKLAYAFYDTDINTTRPLFAQEFSFDRKCGTIQLIENLNTNITFEEIHKLGSISYDASGRYLYVSSYTSQDRSVLLQFDTESPSPSTQRTIIATSYENIGDMALGNDNRIYIVSSISRTFNSRISVIRNPSLQGLACDFLQNSIELSQNPFLGSIGTEAFPQMVHAISNSGPNSSLPVLKMTPSCVGQLSTFELTNKTDLMYDSIAWSFGDGTKQNTIYATHAYASPGKYLVTFQWYLCGNTFTLTDTINIGAKMVFSLGKDTTLCFGQIITLSGPAVVDSYAWNTGDKTQSISVSKAGTYLLKVLVGTCESEASININYHPSLWTALGDEYFICNREKELVKLNAGEGFVKYRWTPTGDTTQWIVVGDLGEYFVIVQDYRGCNGLDGTVVKRRCNVIAHFPNAFTPNGDGLNDVYNPYFSDVVSLHLRIYDRWGKQIFETESTQKMWDGTHEGKPVPADVYVYQADYSGYQNKLLHSYSVKGNVTVIR